MITKNLDLVSKEIKESISIDAIDRGLVHISVFENGSSGTVNHITSRVMQIYKVSIPAFKPLTSATGVLGYPHTSFAVRMSDGRFYTVRPDLDRDNEYELLLSACYDSLAREDVGNSAMTVIAVDGYRYLVSKAERDAIKYRLTEDKKIPRNF